MPSSLPPLAQLDSLTPKTVRFALEDLVGCERDALKAQKNEISDMIQTCLAQQQEEQEDDEQRVSNHADAMDTDADAGTR